MKTIMIRRFFRKSKEGGSSKRPARIVQEKSCGIILFRVEKNERKYLLLHYPSGHWDFPKGHVEEQDSSEFATAHRELEEETGITDIEFHPDYREPMYYEFSRGRKELVKKTVVYFLAETPASNVKISHEHQDYEWLPYEQAFNKLTFDNAKDLLKKAQDTLTASDES